MENKEIENLLRENPDYVRDALIHHLYERVPKEERDRPDISDFESVYTPRKRYEESMKLLSINLSPTERIEAFRKMSDFYKDYIRGTIEDYKKSGFKLLDL